MVLSVKDSKMVTGFQDFGDKTFFIIFAIR
jgi:hypothetical protein